MKEKLVWVSVAVFATACFFQLTSGKKTYRAAVLEYYPVIPSKGKNESEIISGNTANYIKYMKEAKNKGAEIIVFPEGGLMTQSITSEIPEPYQKINPCENQDFKTTEFVRKLSCGSRDNQIYSVVNLKERREYDNKYADDPSKKYLILNTNVVFDRKGTVIARYAKFNLFDEGLTNKTSTPEISFFDTDFDVRFGTFTCFDILFGTPTLQLVTQFGITDFVFPTYWFSELPFLTALQAQRGWAETNNVNLLASGVNYPLSGSGGSGIYNGKFGQLAQTMPEEPSTVLLVADVPKINRENAYCSNALSQDTQIGFERYKEYMVDDYDKYIEEAQAEKSKFFLLRDQIHLYDSAVIESGKRFDQRLCSRNNFCCNFKVYLERTSKESPLLQYRAVVSDGVRKFGKTATGGVQACGVVICNGPTLANCTSRAEKLNKIFKVSEILIEGDFLKTNAFQMPTTLSDENGLHPLPANQYIFEKIKTPKSIKVSMELVWPSTNLNTFAIFGRDFTRDGYPATIVSGAPATQPLLLLLAASAIFSLFK